MFAIVLRKIINSGKGKKEDIRMKKQNQIKIRDLDPYVLGPFEVVDKKYNMVEPNTKLKLDRLYILKYNKIHYIYVVIVINRDKMI